MAISLPPKGSTAKKLGAYFAPLKVEAQSTPNMTVKVAAGSFWTAAVEHMEYIGGTTPLISAPATNAKWVLVTVQSTGQLSIVNGASSASPVLPAASTYQDQLPLAAIFVGDTTTAITSEMIYDLRPLWSIPPDSVSQTQLNDFATITYVDNSVATKAAKTGTTSQTFTLDSSGLYTDVSIIAGGSTGPAAIKFNELALSGSPAAITPRWEFTNDGTTWYAVGVGGGDFYTKTELNAGVLNAYYYTQTQLNGVFSGSPYLPVAGSGVLDSRYYTEAEIDASFATSTHTHVVSEITDFTAQVETINSISPTTGNVELRTNDLLDVTNTGAGNKHVLVHNGTNYVNRFLVTDDLSDIDTTSSAPADKDAMMHNGVKFVNRPLVTSDISDFTGAEFLLITNIAGDPPGSPSTGTAQDVYGLKTFKEGVVIETSLVVTGSDTSIETTELHVTDQYIDINYGETGDGVDNGTGTAGIRVDRGTGGSPNKPNAIIQWDEGALQWEIGVEGNANPIITSSHTHTAANITDFSASVTTELASNDLNEMADVLYLATPVTGEYLRYGVGQWENKVFATDITTELNANNLDQMLDVVYGAGSPIVALSAGDMLLYTGTEWANHVPTKVDISDFVEADYIHVSGNETKTGNLTLNGNLTIGSGTTTINSEIFNVKDAVVTLNFGESGAGVAGGSGTSGILVDRGTEPNALFYWSDSELTWKASTGTGIGSPENLAVLALSFAGHDHVIGDIPSLSITAAEINSLDSIISGAEIGDTRVTAQILDRITRRGDTMDSTANLTFAGGGEVLGLPPTPSVDGAATSKFYVDAHINDASVHITATQNTFLDALNLAGSPPTLAAEVNFLDGLSSNAQTQLNAITSAASTHTSDMDVHLTTNQNTFLDALNLAGSPLTLAAEVNFLDGITSSVQTQLNAKANFVPGSPTVVGNILRIAADGDMEDAGVVVNDVGTSTADLWTANKIDTTKADKVIFGSPLGTGNFAGLDANGNLIDSGQKHADYALAIHTHISTDITDLTTSGFGIDAYLSGTAVLSDVSDVQYAGIANGDFLQRVAGVWINTTPANVSEFVHSTGTESVAGEKTFSDNVIVSGDLTVSGTTTTLGSVNLEVADKSITVNSGYAGVTSGSTGSGIHVIRNAGTGSPLTSDPVAVLTWDDSLSMFKAGISGSEVELSTVTHVHDASVITFTTTGSPEGLSAVTVAAAIDELDAEKAPVASPVFTGVPQLPVYTLGTLPTVVQGGMIYVSDATAGGGSPSPTGTQCFGRTSGSPGAWIDITTGLAVV